MNTTSSRMMPMIETLEDRLLLAADLIGGVADAGYTLPGTLVPGDSGNVRVGVLNQGDSAATGDIKIKLYLSTNILLDADDILIGSGGTAINLGADEWTTVNISAAVPPNVAPDDYYVIAVVDADDEIVESDELNNTARSAQTSPLVWKFGNFDGRRNVQMVLLGPTLEPGDVTSVFSMRGRGWGEVAPNLGVFGVGETAPFTLTVNETNAFSQVIVSADDTGEAFESVTINGALRAMRAPDHDIVGDFTAAGRLSLLNVRNVRGEAGNEVTVSVAPGGGQGRFSFIGCRISDAVFESGIGVRAFRITDWLNTDGLVDSLTAPSAIVLQTSGTPGGVAGSFEADIALDGPGGLRRAVIAGDVTDCDWSITGRAGALVIRGSLTDSTISAGPRIGRVIVGALDGSDILAGIDPAAGRYATAAAHFTTNSVIGLVNVRGVAGQDRNVIDSNISAAMVRRLILNNPQLDNGGAIFGMHVSSEMRRPVGAVFSRDTALGWTWQWRPRTPMDFSLTDFRVNVI